MTSRLALRLLATLVFAGLALFELIHDVQGRSWGAMTPVANRVAFVVVPLFVIGAVAALAQRRWSMPVVALAAFGAVAHGLVLRVADAPGGFVFLAAGPLAFALVVTAAARDRTHDDERFLRRFPRRTVHA